MSELEQLDDGTPPPNPLSHHERLIHPRLDRGLEFARVANFTDAVYAIAMTIIAVELKPPVLEDQHDWVMWERLQEMWPEIFIFFVAFAVMGSYWLANHRFIAGLRGVDSKFVAWLLPYLASVAFLPFPAGLMGQNAENPVAVSVFAVSVAAVSFLEWCLLWRAHVAQLFFIPMTRDGFRWASIGSLMPVVWFLISIPVMWVDTYLGMLVWLLNVPTGILLSRRMPDVGSDDADQPVPAS